MNFNSSIMKDSPVPPPSEKIPPDMSSKSPPITIMKDHPVPPFPFEKILLCISSVSSSTTINEDKPVQPPSEKISSYIDIFSTLLAENYPSSFGKKRSEEEKIELEFFKRRVSAVLKGSLNYFSFRQATEEHFFLSELQELTETEKTNLKIRFLDEVQKTRLLGLSSFETTYQRDLTILKIKEEELKDCILPRQKILKKILLDKSSRGVLL